MGLKKIISRIAEEVHRSKIEELENRLLEMEKDHKLYHKTILDNEKRIQNLEEKLWDAILNSTKIETALETALKLIRDDKRIEK